VLQHLVLSDIPPRPGACMCEWLTDHSIAPGLECTLFSMFTLKVLCLCSSNQKEPAGPACSVCTLAAADLSFWERRGLCISLAVETDGVGCSSAHAGLGEHQLLIPDQTGHPWSAPRPRILVFSTVFMGELSP
jgi:hypothetical protein